MSTVLAETESRLAQGPQGAKEFTPQEDSHWLEVFANRSRFIDLEIERLRRFPGPRKDWAEGAIALAADWSREYLWGETTFGISYQVVHDASGEPRWYSPLFQAFAEDMVNPQERQGAVLSSLKEQMALASQNPGKLVIATSPDGPNGVYEDYLDSFTFVLQSDGKDVRGAAIRTHFTRGEHIKLMNLFLPEKLPEHASEEEITAQAAVIDDPSIKELHDLPEILARIRGTPVLYTDPQTGKETTYGEIKELLKEPELLVALGKARPTIELYRPNLEDENATQEEIREALARMILQVTHLRLTGELKVSLLPKVGGRELRPISGASRSAGIAHNELSNSQLISYLSGLGGCFGSEGGICLTSDTENVVETVHGISRRIRKPFYETPTCSKCKSYLISGSCPNCDGKEN